MDAAWGPALRALAGPRPSLPPGMRYEALLPTSSAAPPAVAVDGSDAVLVDTGAVWVVAVTAAAVPWPGPREAAARPMVVGVLADEAQDWLAQRYAAAGIEAPRAPTAQAFAQAWRAVEEMEHARHALAHHPLVLVDGALFGLAPAGWATSQPLVEAARIAGNSLAAVAKRSSLSLEGVPLAVASTHGVPASQAQPRPATARQTGSGGPPLGPWRMPVPDLPGAFVAKLHARARQVYRVDMVASDEAPWQALVALSRDAVYCGYPYPLALAHNHVALTAGRIEELRARLDAQARRAGPGLAALLEDPHALLDLNV